MDMEILIEQLANDLCQYFVKDEVQNSVSLNILFKWLLQLGEVTRQDRQIPRKETHLWFCSLQQFSFYFPAPVTNYANHLLSHRINKLSPSPLCQSVALINDVEDITSIYCQQVHVPPDVFT